PPLGVAPAWRVACTGAAEGSRPRRYRISPTDGCCCCGAANAPAPRSPDSAITAARATAGPLVGAARPPGRVILGGSKQLLVVVHQLVRGDKALDTEPGFARSRSQQRHRGMTHLLAPVDIEGSLRRDAGRDRAGVILPLGAGVEFACVLGEARRGVLLGVDRDRHHVKLGRLASQLLLKLLLRPARERADR